MKKTIPVGQLSNETRQLFDILNSESDMACVVVGAAFLDTAIATLLQKKFLKSSVSTKLLDPTGILGNFASRADLAYCLGMISKVRYRDMCSIAEIRNLFAHSHLRLTFSDSKVRQLCNQLNEWRIVLHGDDEEALPNATEKQITIRARNQFNFSVVFLINWLLLTALSLKSDITV